MSKAAETPVKKDLTLAEVRYVGPVRARLLEEAGLRSLDDLRAADAERIGGVKGVGLRNGALIKQWLAEYDGVSPDIGVAEANQAIQDDMTTVNAAVSRIRQALPANVSHKKLDRQIEKLLSVLSELPEVPDTLRPKQQRRALKMLHLIAALLEKFAGLDELSDKIVGAFAEELRDRRKRLQEILDPKK